MAQEERQIRIGNQIILSYEDQDEPTQEDIQEYAKWLGIDPEKDFDLMWIAQEGVSAPLPENWQSIQSDAGELYFFNFATGESRWDHPLDQFYKDLAQKELKEKRERAENRNVASSSSSGLKASKRSKTKSGLSDKQNRASSQTKLQPLNKVNFATTGYDDNRDEVNIGNNQKRGQTKGNKDLNRSDTALVLGNLDKPKSTAHLFPSSSEDDNTSISSGYGGGASDLDDDGRSNPLAKNRSPEHGINKQASRKEIDALRMEADELKEHVENLKLNSRELENEMNETRVKRNILMSEYQALQQEYQTLQQNNSEQVKHCEEEFARLSKQNVDLEESMKSMYNQKYSLEDNIAILKDEKQRLEQESALANHENTNLEEEIEKRRREKDNLVLEIEQWNAQLRIVSMKVEEEQQRITSLKKQESILCEKIVQRQEEEYRLQRSSEENLESRTRMAIRLFNQIQALKEDKETIRRQLSNMKSLAASESNSLVNSIQLYFVGKMKELQDNFNRDKDQSQQKAAKEIEALVSKNKDFQKQISDMKQNEVALRDNVRLLNDQLKKKEETNVYKPKTSVKTQTEDNQELKNALAEILRLQNLCESTKARYEAELLQEREKTRKLYERIDSKSSDNSNPKVSFHDDSVTSSREKLTENREVTRKSEEWKRKCFDSIEKEANSLEKAKQFVKQERKKIKKQQEVLQQAREEWKQDMAMLTNHSSHNKENNNLTAMIFSNNGSNKSGDIDTNGAPKMAKILKAVKKILEKQALRLNSEVKQLNRIQQWIKLREEKLSLLKQTVEKSTSPTMKRDQNKLFYSRSSKSSPSGVESPESFRSFDWDSFSDSTEASSESSQAQQPRINHVFKEDIEHESSSIYHKLKRIEEEIRFIHEKIENHFNVSSSSNSPYFVDPASYQSISDQYLSDKWDNFLSKYNKGISLKVLLRKDKLFDFQDQLLQWERDRGVEIQALNEHMRWMKRLHDEMGKGLKFK